MSMLESAKMKLFYFLGTLKYKRSYLSRRFSWLSTYETLGPDSRLTTEFMRRQVPDALDWAYVIVELKVFLSSRRKLLILAGPECGL